LFWVIATLKPFRTRAVLDALAAEGLGDGTVREVMGYGRQKHRLHRYLGSEYDTSYIPKVQIALLVDEPDLAATLRVIVKHARTGRMGDGKVVVLPCLGVAIRC